MTARLLVLLLFFLSGATGLVYQVIWTRQLSLLLGVTVFAAAAVLAAFMGGLALGSWWVGRFIDRSPSPVRVYALLEGGIGLAALGVPFALQWVEPLYVAAARSLEGHFLLFNLVRALLVGLILLVPTTLMGGTVPAIGRFLVDSRGRIGWNVGLLYGVNTFGAVLGCIAAGFVLVPSYPLSRTIWATAAVNLGIAALLLLGRVGKGGESRVPETARVEPSPLSRRARVAVVVFAISGFVSLGYEILWTRTLVAHLHNTSYAFTVMLAVFLTGLALGNSLLMRFYDRIRNPLIWLGGVQILIGLSVVLAGNAYGGMLGLTERLLGSGAVRDWQSAVIAMAVRAGLVLLPSTLLLGMVFPLVARSVCEKLSDLGQKLGGIYAANTAGAIAGALTTAFLFVPLLGLRGSLVLLAGINLALGGLCFAAMSRSVRIRAALVAGLALLLLILGLAFPRQLFYRALERGPWELIYYHEGITDTTGVWEHKRNRERFIVYDDLRGTAGTSTDATNRRQAHIAHLLHPDPKRSLHIGFGVGNTMAAAALHPEVEDLDCVELSPQVRETASYFWTNDGVIDHPKFNLIVDDGRNFLLRNETPYDVMISEPPELFTASVVNLYTVEFYELADRSLNEDGMLVNWIPTYALGTEEIRMLVAAVLEVFPETTLWRHGLWNPEVGGPNQMIVIGSKQPLRIDLERLQERMSDPALRADFERSDIPTRSELLALYIAGTGRLRAWVEGVDPVRDDWTRVDFSTPRQSYTGFGFGYVRMKEGFDALFSSGVSPFRKNQHDLGTLLIDLQEPVAPILEPGPDKARLVSEVNAIQAGFTRKFREWERKAGFSHRGRRRGAAGP